MFLAVRPKTAIHNYFKLFNTKTALRNYFINRTERYTHTNNYIYVRNIIFDISFTSKSEHNQIFDLTNKHYRCLYHIQDEKSICGMIFCTSMICVLKKWANLVVKMQCACAIGNIFFPLIIRETAQYCKYPNRISRSQYWCYRTESVLNQADR